MQAVIYDIGNKWLMPGEGSAGSFEQQYIGLREKEQRIVSDEELLQLPVVSKGHPHYKEWAMRHQSCVRLTQYLEAKKRPLKILEVGCGNGWLSHCLSLVSGTFVTGIDINAFELRQAARVFAGVPGLQFMYGSVDTAELSNRQFDIIVFAASIQYFRSLTGTLNQSMKMLKAGGEIHLLDTHFYALDEVVPASQRTQEYYKEQGFPGLAGQYHHHCINELGAFDHTILYRPSGWFRTRKNPFVWVSVKKNES